jgi:hypothetical protein
MKECCQDLDNRAPGPGPRGVWEGVREREDLVITHCTICDCRHFEVVVDPVELGAQGEPL